MDKIYVISEHAETYHRLLHNAALPALTVVNKPEQATIWLADPPLAAPLLPHSDQLRWLQSTFAGVDALINARERHYQLTNVRGIFGALMAEYVFGYLLNETRHITQYADQQAQRHWQPHDYASLRGRTLAILGSGAIGQHIATVARAFGMRVLGTNQDGRPVDGFEQTLTLTALRNQLSDVDVLVSTLPATTETAQCLNTDFWQYAQDLFFINVGRGATVDEPALIKALDEKKTARRRTGCHAAGAITSSASFFGRTLAFTLPHILLPSVFLSRFFDLFADNYRRWYAGEPLFHQVDFNKGY